MRKLGKILKLFISKEKYEGRINQSELALDEDGVFIDKFYGKDKVRSILITSVKAYEMVKNLGIQINHGDLGENILVDFDLNILEVGSKIQINKTILEITQECTICNHLSKIDKRVPKILSKDRGIFARVIQSGLIKAGEEVMYLEKSNG